MVGTIQGTELILDAVSYDRSHGGGAGDEDTHLYWALQLSQSMEMGNPTPPIIAKTI
jgi:hypothetical protein